ncbi:MAG: transcription antitermination factor NusB [Acidimicrobiia bacterium]
MATRRESRERALELCYEVETRAKTADEVLAELVVEPDQYAVRLVRGVDAHRAAIDELVSRVSENWTLERMPAVDRAVLRIGGYELGWEPELATAIVIDEAVELARRFSTKDSGRFVNALLSKMAVELRP